MFEQPCDAMNQQRLPIDEHRRISVWANEFRPEPVPVCALLVDFLPEALGERSPILAARTGERVAVTPQSARVR